MTTRDEIETRLLRAVEVAPAADRWGWLDERVATMMARPIAPPRGRMDPRRNAPQIKARLGVVPQLDNLDAELTVRENLEMYARYFDIPDAVARARADELLDFVQLSERATDQVEPLSGGMKLSRLTNQTSTSVRRPSLRSSAWAVITPAKPPPRISTRCGHGGSAR